MFEILPASPATLKNRNSFVELGEILSALPQGKAVAVPFDKFKESSLRSFVSRQSTKDVRFAIAKHNDIQKFEVACILRAAPNVGNEGEGA